MSSNASSAASPGSSRRASTITDDGWTGPPMNSGSSPSTSSSSCGTASCDRRLRRTVQHQPECAVLGVLDDEHDGAPEVRIQQARAGDQQLSAGRLHQRGRARSPVATADVHRRRPPSVRSGGRSGARDVSRRLSRLGERHRLGRLLADLQVEPGDVRNHLEQVDRQADLRATVEPFAGARGRDRPLAIRRSSQPCWL